MRDALNVVEPVNTEDHLKGKRKKRQLTYECLVIRTQNRHSAFFGIKFFGKRSTWIEKLVGFS